MIAAADYGGRGDPVVLLHGAGGTNEDWGTIAPLLAEYHHVVAVDLPGHGRSPAPPRPWSFAQALDELARLDLGNPAVVGMSRRRHVPLLATMPCRTLLAVATRALPGAEAVNDLMAAFRRGLDRDLQLAARANPNLTITHLEASHGMSAEIPDQLAALILDHLE